jgi:ATP-dependent exoDNAse (exonuclease V) beta subunit
MKILTNTYNYTPLLRTDAPEGRYYQVSKNGVKLPSVTTILSKTQPADKAKTLENWRNRVGDEEADKIVAEAVLIGEHLHKNLENHILGVPDRTGPMISKIMTELVIKQGLKHVNEVWGVEAQLHHTTLYAGTTDLVGVYKDKPCIMDFKNSRKTKKREWIEDYTLQLAAYAEAHNQLYNTNIKDGVIMMATRDLKYLEFEIFGKEFQTARDTWLRRVEQYHNSLK